MIPNTSDFDKKTHSSGRAHGPSPTNNGSTFSLKTHGSRKNIKNAKSFTPERLRIHNTSDFDKKTHTYPGEHAGRHMP